MSPSRFAVALSLPALLLAGCGLFGGPSTVTLELRGAANLNPNESQESTTVYVRIYQLRDDQSWKDANYLKLWKNDPEVLGQSVIGPYKEVLLDATKTKPVELELDQDAKFLGVMGLFNKAEERSWQQCVAVDEADDLPYLFEGFKIIRKEQ